MTEDRAAAISGFVTRILAERAAAGLGSGGVVGVGWGTVELERAQAEFGGGFAVAPEDPLLAAWCRLKTAPGSLPLVLIEPSTEGPLAAMLARHGEGPLAVWLEAAGRNGASELLSKASPGPFGPERLVLGGPFWGPRVLLVLASPGTIPP
jgi:hypothetical protein